MESERKGMSEIAQLRPGITGDLRSFPHQTPNLTNASPRSLKHQVLRSGDTIFILSRLPFFGKPSVFPLPPFLSVHFSGPKYTHVVMRPLPPPASRTLSSCKSETLSP